MKPVGPRDGGIRPTTGTALPSLRLEQLHSIRFRLVSDFFAIGIQQIHSFRARGVMARPVAKQTFSSEGRKISICPAAWKA
jgi:hypothetical protein